MVALGPLDGVVDQARGGLLEGGRREALLRVEETRRALAGGPVLAERAEASLVAAALLASWGLELDGLGHLGERDVLARVDQLGQRLVAQLRSIHHVLHAPLEVEVRSVRLDHLQDELIVLTIHVEE